ncbi:hypothetical protein GCM10023192_58700 [Amycolatopsis samaneae]
MPTRSRTSRRSSPRTGRTAFVPPAACSCSRIRSTNSGRGLTTVTLTSGPPAAASRFAAITPAYPAPTTSTRAITVTSVRFGHYPWGHRPDGERDTGLLCSRSQRAPATRSDFSLRNRGNHDHVS